jgi:hypothetical protein
MDILAAFLSVLPNNISMRNLWQPLIAYVYALLIGFEASAQQGYSTSTYTNPILNSVGADP